MGNLGKYTTTKDLRVRFNVTTIGTLCEGTIIEFTQKDKNGNLYCENLGGWVSPASPYWQYLKQV